MSACFDEGSRVGCFASGRIIVLYLFTGILWGSF